MDMTHYQAYPMAPKEIVGQGGDGNCPPALSLLQVLGGVVYLTQASPLHQAYSLSLLHRRIGPSLEHQHYRYYQRKADASPFAFVSWAFVAMDVIEQVTTTGQELRRRDWNSGEQLLFMEMLAPFGGCRDIITDLRRNLFADQAVAYAIRGASFDREMKQRPKACVFRQSVVLKGGNQALMGC